jgi:hypothetical protein
MAFEFIDLSGAGNIALIIIVFLVIGGVFGYIMINGVNRRFPKQKWLVFMGSSNTFRWGWRRIVDGKNYINDDLIGLLMGRRMDARPLLPFERSMIYDDKGNLVYVARKLANGTLIPMVIEAVGDPAIDVMRIEAYRYGVQIATEYVDSQDQAEKSTKSVNPLFAILIPALPMIAIVIITFVGIYLITTNLGQAMVEQTKQLVDMSKILDHTVSNIGSIQQGNPVDTGVVIHSGNATNPTVNVPNIIPSNLPINAR